MSIQGLMVTLGGGLLPIMTSVKNIFRNGMIPVIQAATGFLNDHRGAFLAVAGAAENFAERVGGTVSGLLALVTKGDFTGGLGKALGIEEDSRIVGVILGIRDVFKETAGGVRAFGAAFKEGGNDITSSGFAGFLESLGLKARHLTDSLNPVVKSVVEGFAKFGPIFAPLLPQLLNLASALSPVQMIFRAIAPALPQLIDSFGQLALALGTSLGQALIDLTPSLVSLSSIIANGLAGAIQIAMPILVGMASFISDNTWLVWAVVAAFVGWKAITTTVGIVNGALAATKAVMLGVTAASYGAEGATLAVTGAQKVAYFTTALFNGTLWGQATALIASKAATVALVAMYAGEFVAGLARSIASTAASTAAWVANGVAQIAVKAVILGGAAAMGIATAAQWLWNAAMTANPIGLIIVAIGALVGAIIWVATQTTFFQDAWLVMVDIFTNSVGMFSDFFANTGGMFADFFSNTIGMFVDFGKNIGDFFAGLPDMALDAGKALIQGLIDGITGMIGAVGDAIGGVMDFVGGFFPHSPAKRGPFSGSG
jgi:hypothetical protein